MSVLETAVIAFASGSVAAVFVNAVGRYWMLQPVISVRLDRAVGSAYKTRVPPDAPEGDKEEGEYISNGIRLRVENTGLSSIKDCCGFIVEMRRCQPGVSAVTRQEVVELSWAHKRDNRMRDIPRDTFFHMDVVAVFKKRAGRQLDIRHFPLTLKEFLSHPGDYEFDVVVSSDNARPNRITVKFKYDPNVDEPIFIDADRSRHPWWRPSIDWFCSVARSISGRR
jgi:hypothetical protein